MGRAKAQHGLRYGKKEHPRQDEPDTGTGPASPTAPLSALEIRSVTLISSTARRPLEKRALSAGGAAAAGPCTEGR